MSRRIFRMAWLCCALLAPSAASAVGEYAANDHSYGPSVSANGRFLAFTSLASNLVAEDTNGIEDVFVLDRQLNAMTRISTNLQGAQGDGQSWGVAISADGCFAAFASSATNLASGDTNNATDLFRKNLAGCPDANDGVVERVSVSSAEAQAGPVGPTLVGDARYATISGEGRFVAYFACLTGLVAGSDPCNFYIRDVQKGETHAVRTPSGGVFGGTLAIGTRPLAGPAGVEVRLAFSTTLPFVGADTNGIMDVYLGKLPVPDAGAAGPWTYTLVSAGTGNGGNQPSSAQLETSYGVSISRDGDRVSFISSATNLVAGDANGLPDVFVYDDDAATKLTRESEITAIPYVNTAPLSPDGNYVVFLKGTLNTPALEQWVRKTVPGGASVNIGTGAPIGSRLESSGRGAVSDGGTVAAWHSFRYDPVLEGARVDLRDNIVVGTFAGNSLDSRIIASNGRIATAQDGHSRATAISGDGKVVAFSTYAWGYGLGDAGANRDVYLRTLATGGLVRASSGFTSNVVDARRPDLSADGRRVVMLASGTLAQASICGAEAYVPVAIRYDVASPALQCLDADAASFEGLLGNTFSYPSISDDGIWAAFSGRQTSTPFNSQIYLRNLNTNQLIRGTNTGGGLPLGGTSSVDSDQHTFQLSGTGRYLVYSFSGDGAATTPANCAVAGTVALYDRDTATTSLISRIGGGNGTLATGAWASISSDGNYVAMVSCHNLANESPAPAGQNVYLWKRSDQTFQRVPSDRLGRNGPSAKARTRLSGDGRYLAYIADSRCTIRCTTRERQIVMYDRVARSQRVISITSAWGRANGPSGTADDQNVDSFAFTLDMSNDGAKLVFASAATNFVPGDVNAADDVFVVDVATQTIARASGFGTGLAGDRDRVSPTLSIDGTTVAYALKDRDAAIATAPPATAKDPSWPKAIGDKFADIAIVEGTDTTEEVVTVTAGGLPANGDSGEPDLSGDGNVVAYSTDATNLTAANDTNGFTDIVVYDTVADSNVLVSAAPGGLPANGPSEEPAATTKDLGDKYVVAYATDATNLQGIAATTDLNQVSDVVVTIEGTGTELASRATGTNGAIGNGASAEADVMEGGTAVTFSSLASNLKPGDANGTTDIFLRDLVADTTIRISEPTGGGEANGPSSDASIGRDPTQPPNSWIVAFESDASNLVANDLNGSTDIFARIFDGATTTTRLISRKMGTQLPATGINTSPRVSRTGRYIIFVSSAPDLIVGDNNGLPDLFTYRISDGLVTRVSTGVAQVQTNDISVSGDVAVAGNGSALVVFDSAATNLTTAPDSEQAFDVFYRDANGNLVPVGAGDVIFRSGFEN